MNQGVKCNSVFRRKREIGIVRWYDEAGGYGFIARRNGEDVYFHYSAVRYNGAGCVKEGDPVEFSIVDGSNGPQAQEVDLK